MPRYSSIAPFCQCRTLSRRHDFMARCFACPVSVSHRAGTISIVAARYSPAMIRWLMVTEGRMVGSFIPCSTGILRCRILRQPSSQPERLGPLLKESFNPCPGASACSTAVIPLVVDFVLLMQPRSLRASEMEASGLHAYKGWVDSLQLLRAFLSVEFLHTEQLRFNQCLLKAPN